jgi:hypothetical protein
MGQKKAGHGWIEWITGFSIPVTLVLILDFPVVYYLRELFIAELLFALGFGIFLVLACVCYILGVVGDFSWKLMKQEAQVMIRDLSHLRTDLRIGSFHAREARKPSHL